MNHIILRPVYTREIFAAIDNSHDRLFFSKQHENDIILQLKNRLKISKVAKFGRKML